MNHFKTHFWSFFILVSAKLDILFVGDHSQLKSVGKLIFSDSSDKPLQKLPLDSEEADSSDFTLYKTTKKSTGAISGE
jgi:hypothetical protein